MKKLFILTAANLAVIITILFVNPFQASSSENPNYYRDAWFYCDGYPAPTCNCSYLRHECWTPGIYPTCVEAACTLTSNLEAIIH
ncbi:MAG TPA: hypothetical protein VK172_14480 [Lentimicrobium sp.]|jgi:hypothetical protein|nr:hypothetical protein [Lentimicrobium sp.]